MAETARLIGGRPRYHDAWSAMSELADFLHAVTRYFTVPLWPKRPA